MNTRFALNLTLKKILIIKIILVIVKNNDFVEIEFTGRSNDLIFDTTNPDHAKEMGLEKADVKPMIISVGNDMIFHCFFDHLF